MLITTLFKVMIKATDQHPTQELLMAMDKQKVMPWW
jgi:hypothetical protein